MHRVRTLAAAAMMAVVITGPYAMTPSALGQPAMLHLVRGSGRSGGFGGGHFARGAPSHSIQPRADYDLPAENVARGSEP
jgi:hypothetical protein